MLNFILRRLLLMIPTTFGVALVVFLIYQAAPGDPATVMMGIGSGGNMAQGGDTTARADAFKREYGLDRTWAVQFFNYIGPFNLLRDGHPWFSSPWTEREVEQIRVAEGREAELGKLLEIPHLPSVELEERAALDRATEAVAEGSPLAGDELARLERAGAAAYPPLLTALRAAARELGDQAEDRFARLVGALESLTGETFEPLAEIDPNRPRLSIARQWFGWYYADGGGDRVRNSGQEPWGGLLAFDLGREMQTKRPVIEELAKRLKVTVPLSFAAVTLSYLIALPLGIYSVRRQGTRRDGFLTTFLFVLYSIPQFWAGLMLILLFGAAGLDWLPVLGLQDKDADSFSFWEKVWDILLHSILPVVTLTYGSLAYLSRQMRTGMLDVIRQDYIRTARAKGLSDDVVVYKHALRNSMIPVITILASILPILIGGSIIVEVVFDIPGMGKYAYDGLLARDFYIIMATTIFVGVMTQVGILLSDITYSLVDPRIRHS